MTFNHSTHGKDNIQMWLERVNKENEARAKI